jgi:hypothetical protein
MIEHILCDVQFEHDVPGDASFRCGHAPCADTACSRFLGDPSIIIQLPVWHMESMMGI